MNMGNYSLIGINGNAYSIMGYVLRAMKECGFSQEEQELYKKRAMSSNYDHLLRVSIETIDFCNEKE